MDNQEENKEINIENEINKLGWKSQSEKDGIFLIHESGKKIRMKPLSILCSQECFLKHILSQINSK